MKRTCAILAAVLSLAACSNEAQTLTESGPAGSFSLSPNLVNADVHLVPSGSSTAAFDVYRDGVLVAMVDGRVSAPGFVDARPASGSYSYQMCEAGSTVCSNTTTVTVR